MADYIILQFLSVICSGTGWVVGLMSINDDESRLKRYKLLYFLGTLAVFLFILSKILENQDY